MYIYYSDEHAKLSFKMLNCICENPFLHPFANFLLAAAQLQRGMGEGAGATGTRPRAEEPWPRRCAGGRAGVRRSLQESPRRGPQSTQPFY